MTCLGINNEGQLVFDYYHEDDDLHEGSDVYNGADSVLWVNFREAFKSEIQKCYQNLRSEKKLSYDKIVEYFITRQTDKWSISIYNEDSDYKYISMARDPEKPDAGNLNQVRGTGEEHLRYFVQNRLMYCDSKWNATDYENDYIAFRVYTPKNVQGVEPNANITITPYSHIYAGVRFKANGERVKHRLTAGVPQLFKPPSGESFDDTLDENETEDFNDTEAAIYGASELSSLGDLAPLYLGYLDVSKATKLTELIIGSGVTGYQNTFFGGAKGLSIGTNKLLKKIDVRNCPNFTDSLNLSQCPNIQEVYATGSGISGVELPESGYLKQIHLPHSITNLTIKNQQYIETNGFVCEGYDNLSTLHIENVVNIPIEEIINTAQNLSSVRLVGITWQAESEEALRATITKFKKCLGRNDDGSVSNKAVVRGRVKVPSISDELFADIYDNFKDLIVESEGTGTKCVVRYLKYDGTAFYTEVLSEGGYIVDPIEAGYVSTEDLYRPVDAEDEGKMRYVFTGWEGLTNNIQTHVDVRPVYKRQYSINFYKDVDIIDSNYHCTQWVDEGSNASDPIDNVTIFAPTKEGTNNSNHDFTEWLKYEFSEWSELPTSIQTSHDVYALYDVYYPVRFYNGSTLFDEQWVISGGSAVQPAGTPTKVSTTQYDYTFSGWDADYTNITKATTVKATYASTVRSYPVYFHYYNGSEDVVYNAGSTRYGNTATYQGTPPIKKISASDLYTSDDYEWTKKWTPEPIPTQGAITKVNGEEAVHCYPVFKFIATLDDTWDDIVANVENESDDYLFQRYPIGALKNIEFTINGKTYNTVVEIIAHNHDVLADGSKAKLTFFTNELPGIERPLGTTEAVGWRESAIRTFLNNDLFQSLPDSSSLDGNLQGAIKSVKKKYNKSTVDAGGNRLWSIEESEDKCWLASDTELNLVVDKANSSVLSPCFVPGQGEPYSATFSGDASRTRFVYGTAETSTVQWWTRSIYKPSTTTDMAWLVTSSGSCQGTGSISSLPKNIAFGFCI